MLSSHLPSVKDTHFTHSVLTKIHGKPVYDTLRLLADEVKANAAAVPTTLGGGSYGHLGLVLSAARYAALPLSAPWVTPVNPGTFVSPAGATSSSVLGPFHQRGAPSMPNGGDLWKGQDGEVLVLSGEVVDSDTGDAIGGATLDLWQNADNGLYSVVSSRSL